MKRVIVADSNEDISRKNNAQAQAMIRNLHKDMDRLFADIEIIAQYPIYDQLELDQLYDELDYCLKATKRYM